MRPKVLLSLPDDGGKNYIRAFSESGLDVCGGYLTEDLSCDALVLCGGGDIAPFYYGEKENGADPPDKERDKCEMHLFEKYHRARKPIFGICRGIQLINVFMGGSLIQDIRYVKEHKYDGKDKYHEITNLPDTPAFSLFGENIVVNSAHHQACKKIAKGLFVMQKHQDGTVEGIYGDNILGVQWHPERVNNYSGEKIIGYFKKMVLQN